MLELSTVRNLPASLQRHWYRTLRVISRLSLTINGMPMFGDCWTTTRLPTEVAENGLH